MRNRRIRRMFGLGITVMALAGWSGQSRAGGLTTIASFNGTNGYQPIGGVTLDSQGNLFGTTSHNTNNVNGSVWEIASGSNTINTIASFNGTNGASPWAGVTLDSQGNLYGTTQSGGASGDGAVWEIVKGSNTITTLASFNGTNGSMVRGGVTFDSNGNLYGTTQTGGANSGGTVWEIVKGSSAITTLGSFNFNASYGSQPIAGVTFDSHGNLFGTTSSGGSLGTGAVWEIAKGSGTITTFASFSAAGFNAKGSVTIDAQGNLYGTTSASTTFGNKGTVWEIASGTNTITNLVTFTGANGSTPYSGVTLDGQGNLYGTTTIGGANNMGTLFEIVKGSSTITTLVSFNGSNGAEPYAGVTFDSSGNVYGTTLIGGANNNDGTVFELGTNAVPEPSSLFMGFIGLAVMGGFILVRHQPRSARVY